MKSYFLLIIFFLTIGNSLSSECSHFKSDCEYYTCIEEVKRCGKKSYIENFGKKYCKKFFYKEYKFSNSGKIWINEAKKCLIQKMELFEDSLSCKKFKKEAIKAHVPCYLEAGYCSLPLKDKMQVQKVIFATMWRPSIIGAGLKILKQCR